MGYACERSKSSREREGHPKTFRTVLPTPTDVIASCSAAIDTVTDEEGEATFDKELVCVFSEEPVRPVKLRDTDVLRPGEIVALVVGTADCDLVPFD